METAVGGRAKTMEEVETAAATVGVRKAAATAAGKSAIKTAGMTATQMEAEVETGRGYRPEGPAPVGAAPVTVTVKAMAMAAVMATRKVMALNLVKEKAKKMAMAAVRKPEATVASEAIVVQVAQARVVGKASEETEALAKKAA